MELSGVAFIVSFYQFPVALFFVTFHFILTPIGRIKKMNLKAAVAFIFLWALDETTANESGNLTIYQEPHLGSEQAVSVHSRRKRYIVFPKGSSLQLLLEVLSHVPTRFRVLVGPTLQVAWELPSELLGKMRSKRSFVSGDSCLKHHVSNSKSFFNCNSDSPEEKPSGESTRILRDVASLLDLLGTTLGLAWQLPDDPMIHHEFKKKHKVYKRNVFKKMEQFLRPSGANGRQCVLKALCESGQRTPSKKDFLREILHKIFSMDAEEENSEDSDEDVIYRKAHQSQNQNCDKLYPECQFSIFSAIQ